MLRKTVILLAATVLTGAMVSSPAVAGMLPTFGVKAGANFSNIDTDDITSSSRTGFVGGVFVNLAWPIFNLQPELLYSQKGFNDAAVDDDGTADFTVGTIQVPILCKFKLPIPVVAPSLYIGPAVSFTTSATAKLVGGDVDVKDSLESSNWSMILGLDLTLFNMLIVDARYDMGLSSFSKDAFADLGNDVKGRTFTVMVGIGF